MRDGWEIKKLGDIATFQRGLTYAKEDEVEFSNNCVLRSNNIDLETMSILLDELKYIREDFVVGEDKKVKRGSILICMSNGSKQHLGKVAFIDKDYDCAFGGFMGLIKPNSGLSPKFLYYSCISSSYKHFLASVGNGANINNIKFSDLSQFSLPVPPLTEQERIVEELDLLSGIIGKQKQQLKEYDTLAQSIFYDMFGDPITNEKGWEMVVFESACSSITKGPFGSDIKKSLYVERSDDAYKVYIQANAIEKDLTVGTYYISKEYFDEKMFRFEVHPYDYIITCDGTLGKFIRLPETVEKGIISASLLRLSIREEILSPKYFEFIWDEYMLPLLVKDVRNTALKHLPSAGKIGKVCIPLPDIKIQREFASKIEAIEKQKAILKKSIEETELLFNSRMDYYFN